MDPAGDSFKNFADSDYCGHGQNDTGYPDERQRGDDGHDEGQVTEWSIIGSRASTAGSGGGKNPRCDSWYEQLAEGVVELSKMSLDSIPKFLFEYRHPIKIVYLQDNTLHELPSKFFDELPHLAWCDLRYNQLEKLPELTQPHNCLRVLMLQNNQLTTLPYSLGVQAANIRTLGLNGNPLHDPPKEVIEAGVPTIRAYMIQCLRNEAIARGPPDYLQKSPRAGGKRKGKGKKVSQKEIEMDNESDEDEDVPNFPKALYEHVARRKNNSKKSGQRKGSKQHSSPFHGMHPKTMAKVKYTNDIWRDVPYEGVFQKQLLERSLEEMRKHVLRRFASQRDKLLQRIKDKEVLLKWRFETRQLQKADRRPGSCCLVTPPYGVSTDVVQEDEPSVTETLEYRNMNPEEFQKEVSACSQKLQAFIDNPTPITNSSAALQRLKEVEDIQRRLCSLKLCAKAPIPT